MSARMIDTTALPQPTPTLGVREFDNPKVRHVRMVQRLVRRDEAWFVRTREGERGPFDDRRHATAELQRYVETMTFFGAHTDLVPDHVDPRDVTIVQLDLPRIF